MTVREDRIDRPGGGPAGLYAYIDKRDFTVVVPVEDDHVHLVEQYRYPVRARFWEFPQGSAEESEDDRAGLARRELREETGLTAGRLDHLGRLHSSYGNSNQGFDVWLATELVPGPQQLEPEEADLVHARVEVAEFERMILDGRVTDAPTIAAWMLLRLAGPSVRR